MAVLTTASTSAIAMSGTADGSVCECEDASATAANSLSREDQAALELGRMVLAVDKAIENPGAPGAMGAVTELGHDQRYYVLVRGWLSYQLQGDVSMLEARRESTSETVKARIDFLRSAIRMVDLE